MKIAVRRLAALTTCLLTMLGSSQVAAANGKCNVRISEREAARFVDAYHSAWQSRSQKLAELWHPDGKLIDSLYDRELQGSEIAKLTDGQLAETPICAGP